MLVLGLRRGEVLGLVWESIDESALEIGPRVAMQILRHSRISLTIDIYTDVPDPATREALGKLGNWPDQADDDDEEPPEEAM